VASASGGVASPVQPRPRPPGYRRTRGKAARRGLPVAHALGTVPEPGAHNAPSPGSGEEQVLVTRWHDTCFVIATLMWAVAAGQLSGRKGYDRLRTAASG
jgi:hypothetical protein